MDFLFRHYLYFVLTSPFSVKNLRSLPQHWTSELSSQHTKVFIFSHFRSITKLLLFVPFDLQLLSGCHFAQAEPETEKQTFYCNKVKVTQLKILGFIFLLFLILLSSLFGVATYFQGRTFTLSQSPFRFYLSQTTTTYMYLFGYNCPVFSACLIRNLFVLPNRFRVQKKAEN
jgi:hypothetical protein